MPLSQDPLGGGTEADGTRSTEYCSYCYRDGAFFDPNMTIDGMIAKLEQVMGPMHLPPEVVQSAKDTLPYLNRWRSQ